MATEKNQEQQFEKIETEKKKGSKVLKYVGYGLATATIFGLGVLAGNKNARTKVVTGVKNTFSRFGSKKPSESPATTEQPVVDNGGSVEQPQQQFSYGGNNGERKYRTEQPRNRFNSNFNN